MQVSEEPLCNVLAEFNSEKCNLVTGHMLWSSAKECNKLILMLNIHI